MLVEAIENAIAEGFPRAMGEDVGVIERLQKINKPCDVDGLIHLLVHTRGDLHHYAGTKKKATGSPFDERPLSVIGAIFLMVVPIGVTERT